MKSRFADLGVRDFAAAAWTSVRSMSCVSLLLLPSVQGVAQPIVGSVVEQHRSTFVRADFTLAPSASRADSALGFDPFDSSLDVRSSEGGAGTFAHSEQHSVVTGDSIVVRGTVCGWVVTGNNVFFGEFRGHSNYSLTFVMSGEYLGQVRLTGHLRSHAEANGMEGGYSSAVVTVTLLTEGGSPLLHSSTCHPLQGYACSDSTQFTLVRDLDYGRFSLEVYCEVASGGALSAAGGAEYDVVMTLNGVLVGIRDTTWTAVKALYR